MRQYGGEPTSHTAVAILGGFSRKGDWVVPKTFNAFMMLGGGEIDLRDARFAEREVSIHVVAILGGCEITVPEDATVNVNGVGIMGAFEHSAQGSRQPGRTGDQHQRGRLHGRRRRHPQAAEEVQAREARGQAPPRTRIATGTDTASQLL